MSASDDRAIEDYGLLGDTRTAALVASDGAIDWMCVPCFDGPPVFGRLVGGPAAGTFAMGPARPSPVVERAYRNGTTTLQTTWEDGGARLTLTEAMIAEVRGSLLPTTLLVRRLSARDGPIEARIDFDPRLGEHHQQPRVEHRGAVTVCSWEGTALALECSNSHRIDLGRRTAITITPDEPLTVTLGVAERGPLSYVHPDIGWAALEADERRWRAWGDGINDALPHREMALRSLLTLRLLTYSPSGAPVAAPTTSLPEDLGGSRNWDYRFAWPRDASIGVGAFLGTGQADEARRFLA
jgi:GH15 family glucan-1,4-alpha-glucosidase